MPVTNASLLLRLRREADAAGWREFVDLYEPLLRGFVRRSGLQDPDAADVVQEIFLRLLRSFHKFEYSSQRGRFRDWLKRVARNAVTDWRRRGARHWSAALPGDVATADDASVEIWNREHRRNVLAHALRVVRADVSASSWRCFAQYVLQGRSADAVARDLRITRAAVYVVASRIRVRVQRKCIQFDEDLCDARSDLSRRGSIVAGGDRGGTPHGNARAC